MKFTKKGLQAIFPFQDTICRIKDVTNLTITTLQFQIAGISDLGFAQLTVNATSGSQVIVVRLQKTRICICLPVNCAKDLAVIEEIIHIQEGSKT